MINEAWKPLPECLADDLWPCVPYFPAAVPHTAATVDPFASYTEEEWPRVWIAHSVLHKPEQRHGRLIEGTVLAAKGGAAAAAESVLLADPSGEALALA